MGQEEQPYEEKIKEAEELVEKIKGLLKEREGQEYELIFMDYDIDEEPEDDSMFFDDENLDDIAIFYGLGWNINDEIYLKRLYLDDDALMFDLLNRPYHVWPGELDDFELLEGYYSGIIIERLCSINKLRDFNGAMKTVIKLMQGQYGAY